MKMTIGEGAPRQALYWGESVSVNMKGTCREDTKGMAFF